MSSYLDEFQTQINHRDFSKFLQLWEEYCTSDTVDVEEFSQILKAVKHAEFAKQFGRFIETALPMWEMIQNPSEKYLVLKHLIDLQTTNSPTLADLTINAIQAMHGSHPLYHERIRLAGLRQFDNFQYAISHYDILAHLEKGNFVFHSGGWGTGEIMEVSQVREQAAIEFENVSGLKHITFANAFKNLTPLASDSFLARRFANADKLEEEAKENPVAIIKSLLKDLGPKNAGEIKDELCELVIPEKEWAKWWQSTRTKLKKDPLISTPENLRDNFYLRRHELTQEDRLKKVMQKKDSRIEETILSTYNFIRDLPNLKKNQEVKNTLKEQTLELLSTPLSTEQELQVLMILESFFEHKDTQKNSKELILNLSQVEKVINSIEIIALKKRALTLVREVRPDWQEIFLNSLLNIPQSALRDYLLKELNSYPEANKHLVVKLKDLTHTPQHYPEFFVWYFQKLIANENDALPFNDKEGRGLFFESLLILLSIIDTKPEYRDLSKKIYIILSGKRYAVVRSMIEGTDIPFIKEFLLLIAKCQSLSDHDIKILRSLAFVVHPSLAEQTLQGAKKHVDGQTIWTTQAGYLKIQERIKEIGTTEIIENAREVEAARALGDLRENSEYKFACEKRARLQGELKSLSEELNKARIITKDDIFPEEIGVGSVIEIEDPHGKVTQYSILGPWDANPDHNILSFQSKLAQAMIGCRVGDTFKFKDDEFHVKELKSIFDKS